jgi:hypothetical protein
VDDLIFAILSLFLLAALLPLFALLAAIAHKPLLVFSVKELFGKNIDLPGGKLGRTGLAFKLDWVSWQWRTARRVQGE